jgi:hypothetical protein
MNPMEDFMGQCVAKSKRSQVRCKKGATPGKNVCHMHGGKSPGPKTEKGRENSRKAVLKEGKYTAKVLEQHKQTMVLIRQCKEFIRSID